MREKIDQVLLGQPPGAIWFFLADRSLPAENRQTSVRLQRKRAQNRQILLCAADYRRLADLLRPLSTIATCDSTMSTWRYYSKKAHTSLEAGYSVSSTPTVYPIRREYRAFVECYLRLGTIRSDIPIHYLYLSTQSWHACGYGWDVNANGVTCWRYARTTVISLLIALK